MKNPQNVLRFVSPNIIHFDMNNPRGESEDKIINDSDFKRLRRSIRDVGVIVPIVVRPNIDITDHYYLIDGERRLRASIEEKQNEVPIRIVKDEMDGRILAYQIHMHRKDWSRNAEAKAIMTIIKEEMKKDDSLKEEDLKQKLVEITDHTNKEIQEFLNLFKYEQDIIDLVINKSKEYPISYIDQIEASFISPLKRYYNTIYIKYGETNLRKIMGYKFKKNLLVKTRYLMDTFNSVFQSTENKNEIESILNSFLKDKNKNISDSFKEFESISKDGLEYIDSTGNKINKTSKKGKTTSKKFTTKKSLIGLKHIKIKPTKKEQTSVEKLINKYSNPDNNFSKEEREYISEAVRCIEEQCYKAAALMIWATGISRIYSFIEKDFTDFISSSKIMQNKPTQVYHKEYTKRFNLNATKIDGIKISSFDPQLLCYLYYKGIITVTQFKKLKGNYDTRNDSAHPTDIDISTNRIVEIFDNIYDLILNNPKLR
jgi:ParB/RepB/Spo0J family partition protein